MALSIGVMNHNEPLATPIAPDSINSNKVPKMGVNAIIHTSVLLISSPFKGGGTILLSIKSVWPMSAQSDIPDFHTLVLKNTLSAL
ncbi:hypothetical protein D3C76_1643870 [compost metagenome]